MKLLRYLLIIFCLFQSLCAVYAQSTMTDEQIMAFIVKERENNSPRSAIVTKLMERGVTIDRIRKIRDKYEKQQKGEVVGARNISGVSNQPEGRLRRNQDFENNYHQAPTEDNSNKTPYQIEVAKKQKEQQMLAELDGITTADSTSTMLGNKKSAAKRIFGRDIFNKANLTFEPQLNIATPNNYVLGPGDAIYIDVWGASQKQYAETVTPEGAIHIEGFGPIAVGGMTVAQANQAVRQKLGARFGGSNIKLTVGQTKSIMVHVMGEVESPGTLTLPAFSTVFHALYSVGGTNEIGTMRDIKVYRNNRLVSTIDLYDYILNGNMKGNIRLVSGDVIIVHPYANLVNISGKVKRPMYYEMKSHESVATLIAFAGGFTGDAYEETVRLIRQQGGVKSVFTLDHVERGKQQLADADSVFVDSVLDRFRNLVELKGAVLRPGQYQMDGNITTIRSLIEAAGGLSEEALTTRGIIHRRKEDRTLEVENFDIARLMAHQIADIALRNEDVVFIPSNKDLYGDRTLTIIGEVKYPGQYAFAENMTIEDFIVQAGGLTDRASLAKVDVSRRLTDPMALKATEKLATNFSFSIKEGFVIEGEAGFKLQPYDEVFVRMAPGSEAQERVMVSGEVEFSGFYVIDKKNFRLSDLVKAAGGPTAQAYLKGARLIRNAQGEDLLKLQQLRKVVTMDDSTDVRKMLVDPDRSIGINLDKALAHPGDDRFDIILQSGDYLSIPKLNNTISVNGEVMYPNSVAYKPHASLSYYINQCGGYRESARTRRVYAVNPNGTVSRIRSASDIQPGANIVVPARKERKGVDLSQVISIAMSLSTVAAVLVNAFKK